MTSQHHKLPLSGVMAMLASDVLFSVMSAITRFNSGIPALWYTVFRFSFGMAIILALCLLGKARLTFKNKKDLLIRGLFGAISVILLYWPIQLIGLAKTSVLYYTYPVFAAVS